MAPSNEAATPPVVTPRPDTPATPVPTTPVPTVVPAAAHNEGTPPTAPVPGQPEKQAPVIIDAQGNAFVCTQCSNTQVDLGAPAAQQGQGPAVTYSGDGHNVRILNPGRSVTVNGDHNQINADGGSGNTAQAGDGNHNQVVTGPGDNNQALVGNGNANRATAGYGSHNTATTGDGTDNKALTGAGSDNLASVGNGNNNTATTGRGSGNTAAGGDGDNLRITTGAGNDNHAEAGNGSNNQVTAGRGSGNTALTGDGNHNRVITGAGNDNLAAAGHGDDNQVTAGGPGNRNLALAGDGDRNRVVTGPGDDNLAAVGAGNDNYTRTGPGNRNSTLSGPGENNRTQLGSGQGNTANQHLVGPNQTRAFTPLDVPEDRSPVLHPDQPRGGILGAPPPLYQGLDRDADKQGPGHVEPLVSPYLKSVESGAQNYIGKYNRYQRTLRDATTRHLIASDQMRTVAGSLRDSTLPGTNTAAGLADRYGQYREGRARWYGSQSDRLGQITKQNLDGMRPGNMFKREYAPRLSPVTGQPAQTVQRGISGQGLHGYLPERVQRGASWTPADRINRIPAPDKANPKTLDPRFPQGTNPAITDNPAVKANPRLPVSTNMTEIGGPRLLETGRRALTKVAGPTGLILGAGDVAYQIHQGVKPGEAIGKTGAGIVVSAAAGGAATAALSTAAASALVPGPGWAVAGGIIVGIGASYAWDALGGSEKAAQFGGWAQDKGTEAVEGIKNTAVDAWNGVTHAFG